MDVALAVALGGDCLADVGMLRCEPAVFGPVASDPAISRLIDTLAASGEKALQAIRSAQSGVRHPAWSLTGKARFWEPCRLRFRLFSEAAQLVSTGRRRILCLAQHRPRTGEITAALERLAFLPNPD